MPRYKVEFEFDCDADSPEESVLKVLSLFGDGMSPVADVTEIDEDYKEIGNPVSVDTEKLGQ